MFWWLICSGAVLIGIIAFCVWQEVKIGDWTLHMIMAALVGIAGGPVSIIIVLFFLVLLGLYDVGDIPVRDWFKRKD
jgi:hypothetical protein